MTLIPRLMCTSCGMADIRPHWQERSAGESITACERHGHAVVMSDLEKETAMRGKKTFVVAAVTVALIFVGPALAARDDMDTRDHPGGAVVPCSLDGVNPAYHPEIFANPAVAAAYGFVRSADGIWHVGPGCHR